GRLIAVARESDGLCHLVRLVLRVAVVIVAAASAGATVLAARGRGRPRASGTGGTGANSGGDHLRRISRGARAQRATRRLCGRNAPGGLRVEQSDPTTTIPAQRPRNPCVRVFPTCKARAS